MHLSVSPTPNPSPVGRGIKNEIHEQAQSLQINSLIKVLLFTPLPCGEGLGVGFTFPT